MTDMARTRVALDWPNGGPGVTTYYWTSGFPAGPIDGDLAEEFHTEIADFWSNIGSWLVSGLTWSIETDVSIIAPETGALTDIITQSGDPLTGTGTSTKSYASRAQQLCVSLKTTDFTDGKRLQGRHFVGPIGGDPIGTDGLVTEACQESVVDYYTAMISGVGPRLAVWHRPQNSASDDGRYADVASVRCNARPGGLRSRRD